MDFQAVWKDVRTLMNSSSNDPFTYRGNCFPAYIASTEKAVTATYPLSLRFLDVMSLELPKTRLQHEEKEEEWYKYDD